MSRKIKIIKEFEDPAFCSKTVEVFLPLDKWFWGLGTDGKLYYSLEYWEETNIRPSYYPKWELFEDADIGIDLPNMIKIVDQFKDLIAFL